MNASEKLHDSVALWFASAAAAAAVVCSLLRVQRFVHSVCFHAVSIAIYCASSLLSQRKTDQLYIVKIAGDRQRSLRLSGVWPLAQMRDETTYVQTE